MASDLHYFLLLKWHSDLETIPGIGPATRLYLQNSGVYTTFDLIRIFQSFHLQKENCIRWLSQYHASSRWNTVAVEAVLTKIREQGLPDDFPPGDISDEEEDAVFDFWNSQNSSCTIQ